MIAAAIWATGEIASMNHSGNGIPMSDFPKSALELDQPISPADLTVQ